MIDERLDTYDWEQAFLYVGELPKRAPVLSDVDNHTFTRENVAAIAWLEEGENDGPSWLIGGVLDDGRWFFLEAGCDYTGWDCRAGGSGYVATCREDIERFAMSDIDRDRLGVQLRERA